MALRPGLFGKMPAHGDFVRRGWDDATVGALDRWFGDAVLRLRDQEEPENNNVPADPVAQTATYWRIWAPAGTFGAAALHMGVARSFDRAGRAFVLAVGVAGLGAWRHAQTSGPALERAMRAALSGEADADATFASVAVSAMPGGEDGDGGDAPDRPQWWRGDVAIGGGAVDTATLAERLRTRVAA